MKPIALFPIQSAAHPMEGFAFSPNGEGENTSKRLASFHYGLVFYTQFDEARIKLFVRLESSVQISQYGINFALTGGSSTKLLKPL